MKSETNTLKATIIQTADPAKEKIAFCYYRLAKGISGILPYAKRASGFGSGQNVLHTVNFALSFF